MADFLVQRLDLSGPADADGVWVDEGTFTLVDPFTQADVKAGAETFVLGRNRDLGALRRISRWDSVIHFMMQTSGVSATQEPKTLRTKA